MDLTKVQLELEDLMLNLGHDRYQDRKKNLEKRGEGSNHSANLKVAHGLLPEVTKNLEDWIVENSFEGRGKRHSGLLPIKTLGAQAAAQLGLRSVFNNISNQVHSAMIGMGRGIETELAFKHLEEVSPKAAKTLFKFRKAQSSTKRMLAVSRASQVEEWDNSKRVNVAEPVMNAILKTGMFEMVPHRNSYLIGLTQAGREMIRDIEAIQAFAMPLWLPMVVPPRRWLGEKDGGYTTEMGRACCKLVKTRDKEQRGRIRAAIKSGTMQPFMDAINTIQETPWAINTEILELVKWVFEEGHGTSLKSFPSSSYIPRYDMPEGVNELPRDIQVYHYRQAAKVREANMATDSEFAVLRNDLETAEYFNDFDAFWLPHSTDKRGRIYPIPHFNYQRSDHIKAMFQFAEGKPLGQDGLKWLEIHLANCGDFDKVSKKSFADRRAWILHNRERILEVAADPKATFDWWSQADKPFCFVAACIDLAAALEGGSTYVSYLPIALDGSNSGLQHYSMALRAEDEGRMVCLADLEAPEDVYRIVAEESARLVAEDLTTTPTALQEVLEATVGKAAKETPTEYQKRCADTARKTLEAARLWTAFGIDRSVVKRNVMTFSYSSETFGFRQQLMEDLMRPLNDKVLRGELEEHPFDIDGDGGYFASGYLAKKNWQAVTTTVSKAAEAMKWMKRASQLLAHEGKPMTWVTPTGFPCINRYTELELSRVKLFLFDQNLGVNETAVGKVSEEGDVYRRVQFYLAEKPGETIIKHKAASTIAPNVIHSMDASHLMLTVNLAKRNEIEHFQLIHDSFATHAGETEKFFWLIRDAFVDMYKDLDLFGYLHAQVSTDLTEEGKEKLPSTPDIGYLDLETVRLSRYSFA